MEPVVIKISGSLTDEPGALALITAFVKNCAGTGRPVVLIHGGGKQINALSGQLGVPVQQVAGRRVTDASAMHVLACTVGGSVNLAVVDALRKAGIRSVGITGADGGLTTSARRAPLIIDGKEVDFGLVGEIESVDVSLAELLLSDGFVPVIGCITWSESHGLLNINADTFAITLAAALGSSELVMLMEPEAVLDANGNPIPVMDSLHRDRGLAEGWIRDGMIPKLHTGFIALEKGVASVRLTNPAGLASGTGTLLVNEDSA